MYKEDPGGLATVNLTIFFLLMHFFIFLMKIMNNNIQTLSFKKKFFL